MIGHDKAHAMLYNAFSNTLEVLLQIFGYILVIYYASLKRFSAK